ncbi:hypothetical protein FOZ63_033111 [Perkinsus olseni]|uniref:PB1 domain-containing protein n=1 Tax=Perkinsus olseni TaxID=32597 RepID=A0A7J6RLR5_PEROL|nr:hypothetical protein FOZ62_024490 [Perkinsus olseni]KAF4751425.1 hypothetical protein FOZ63_033111 [Perkinsus olseni]
MPVFIKMKYGTEVHRWRIFYVPALPDVHRCLYEKWPQLRGVSVNIFYMDDDGDKCHLTEASLFDAWEIARQQVKGTDRTPTLKLRVERQACWEGPSWPHDQQLPSLAGVPCLLLPLSHFDELQGGGTCNDWIRLLWGRQSSDECNGLPAPRAAENSDYHSDAGGSSVSGSSWQEVPRQNDSDTSIG